ncbi:RDD family protein [Bacillus sp. NTK071]|uniref:RDD family protein n=1 Tax=Bacillus sp. NTK071 TaxID=2802175 RepID=UPI001A8FC4A8|nr:RDD family protein [Bacillus sp. NTK071]MBN8209634.1 RDD family protein [Bacillus sp. NTK071]
MDHTVTVGFWPRVAACLVDAVLLGVPLSLLNSYVIQGQSGEEVSGLIQFVYYFLLPILWYGYTVGKRVLGIRIVRMNGQPPGFLTMVLRIVVGTIVYVLTIGIGFLISIIMVATRADHRALHDLIAGTYVTKASPVNE